MTSTYLTASEYTQAKSLASQALLAFNTRDHDSLTLVVSQALDSHEGAKTYDRDASVTAMWSTLAHMGTVMIRDVARGTVSRSSEVRFSFHSTLVTAKKAAKAS